MANLSKLIEVLAPSFENRIRISEDESGLNIEKNEVVKLLTALKDINYKMLAALTSVEYEDRFEMIYVLMSPIDADTIKVIVKLQKGAPCIPSIISIWKAADVQEREIFDLMGITFEGHGNLKRILCPDDFVGHPLRKDFKLNIIDRF